MTKKPINATTINTIDRSGRGDFFKSKSAALTLSDKTIFHGKLLGRMNDIYSGEVVFNTGMTGYTESLTDPSYAGQILVFTYPLIGNYGVQVQAAESDKIQVSGVVVSEAATNWSHSRSDRSLLDWLHSQNIPLITEVDTRALTKHLRLRGTMRGAIGAAGSMPTRQTKPTYVSIGQAQSYNPKGSKKVILVDCGLKQNILRSLLEMNLQVKQVPYDYDYSQEDYDGVLLSNGPGNPEDYQTTISVARRAMALNKPIFGICLGSQLMALAAGAKTYKLKYGHRGHNQPCLDTTTSKAYITSQNHGYAIAEDSLPKDWSVSLRNLNDDSVEGIRHRSKPFFSVQFHPEACPGPTDTHWLFEGFYKFL